jgi:hypothetical protein
MIKTFKNILVTSIVTLMAFLAVGYAGCKKTETKPSVDLCETMTCQNGGICFKGECTCKEGYEGKYCETKWLSRYVGTWDIAETTVGSTDATKKNKTITYRATIAGKQGNDANFIISNFMGNAAYKAECRIGLNEKQGVDVSTKYIFVANQVIGDKQLYDGWGSVNSTGKIITGTYFLVYPTDKGPVRDTVSFTGEYMP